MTLINFLQDNSNPFLDVLSKIFSIIGSVPFFFLVLSIFFLFINKENSYKMGISFSLTFLFTDLFLKNIIKRPRPYMQGEGTLINENLYYTYATPSFLVANASGATTNIFAYSRKKISITKSVLMLLTAILFICLIVFSKMYFMQNYLLDVLVGAVIGFLIYFLVYKFFNFKYSVWHLFGLIIPITLLLCFVNQWFNIDGYTRLFEVCGISTSLMLGYFLEEKFIKYEIKNNIVFTFVKITILFLTTIMYYFLCKYLFKGCQIVSFLQYFIFGMIIFFVLPLIFKKLEKYFYIFSNEVKEDRVEFSSISLSVKQTRNIARKICKDLKPGEVVVLQGDLGAGKSVLVRNILQLLGVTNHITSPTFTLVNEYQTKDNHFYHFDMYRLEDEEEVNNIGFEEILDNQNAIKFIEWAENVPSYLPSKYKKISIIKLGKNMRNIILENIDTENEK